jgi:hypothetical protein
MSNNLTVILRAQVAADEHLVPVSIVKNRSLQHHVNHGSELDAVGNQEGGFSVHSASVASSELVR